MFILTSPTTATKPLLMDSLPKLRHSNLSLNHHRSSFPSPLSPTSLPPPPSSFRFPSIRASSSQNDPAFHKPSSNISPQSLPPLLQTLSPLFSPVVETTCIVIAATVFFFMRFHYNPVIAAPLSPPPAASESFTEHASKEVEEAERAIEEQLSRNPDDTDALRSLLELKVRGRNIEGAIEVIDRLIALEPEEFEWPLLKANMLLYNSDLESARNLFEEILQKDPFRVEAYHGLVMVTSDSKEPLTEMLKRAEAAVEACKKQKKDSDVRDFKLLIAQIRVMEGNYPAALNAYQDLVKDEPRDFRPYLCLGILYTLLENKAEAEKQFDKFRRLVPKDHPYRDYFEDNMNATKFFSQKFQREGASAMR
ncbi:hypothetical protein RJT34_18975 [Clitoria ternatea]|uniref:Uncharacterized protein n=1 Tax=Clitoria ternatea TaxID=43366 RepID=A0AAN9IQK0_CLITE